MIDNNAVERLAQAIHEQYLAHQLRNRVDPSTSPAIATWAELGEELREANRAQARYIQAKLAKIGCSIATSDPQAEAFTFANTEIETLARHEHERWSRQRTQAGWTHGDTRDEHNKHHPSLVPWDQLPEPERNKDRNAIRAIADILAAAGLRPCRD